MPFHSDVIFFYCPMISLPFVVQQSTSTTKISVSIADNIFPNCTFSGCLLVMGWLFLKPTGRKTQMSWCSRLWSVVFSAVWTPWLQCRWLIVGSISVVEQPNGRAAWQQHRHIDTLHRWAWPEQQKTRRAAGLVGVSVWRGQSVSLKNYSSNTVETRRYHGKGVS